MDEPDRLLFLRWWKSRRDFAAGVTWLMLGVVVSTAVVGASIWISVDQKADDLDATAVARCGMRGYPVTLNRLVRVFRANGISLEINQRTCAAAAEQRSRAALPDGTNAGSSGINPNSQVERREGTVFCRVYDSGALRKVGVVKFPTDTETRLSVLNVGCTLYPHDSDREATQVARVRAALAALVPPGS